MAHAGLVAAVAWAWAAPAAALFLERGGPGDPVKPGDPLVFRSESAVTEADAPIFVLDGVDVSGFARRDGKTWVLELPAQLEPGAHELVAISRYGTAERRQAFALEVRESRVSAEVAGAVDGQLSHRAADNALATPPELDRAEGRGSMQWRAALEAGPARFSAYAPLIYDSGGKESGLGRHWDVADFLGTLELGRVSFRAGQHAAGAPSLILQGIGRRGVSTRIDGPAGTFGSVFHMRTEPITGFRERFGFDDERNRLQGVSVGTERLPLGEIGALYASATWLEASGGEGGAATAGLALDRGTEHGRAGDATVEVSLFDGGLVMGGEWARTRFDFDGGGGASSIVDQAWQMYAEAALLQGEEVWGYPADLRIRYRETDTGPFFRSLGNPGAPSDLHTWDGGVDVQWAGLSLWGSYSRLQDNVDDADEIITYRDETWAFDGSYTPVLRGDPAWRRWIGVPTVQAGWSRYRSRPVANEPLGNPVFDGSGNFVGFEPFLLPNGTTRTLYVSARTAFEKWNLGVSHTIRRFDEATFETEDQITKSSSAQLFWQVHPRVSLQVDGSREVTRFRDPAFKSTTKRVGGSIRHRLMPGRLDGTLRADWQQSQNSASPRTADRREWLITAVSSWHVWPIRGNRPGLSLSVLGTYRDVIDEAFRPNSLDGFQVFARVELLWSPRKAWGPPFRAGGIR